MNGAWRVNEMEKTELSQGEFIAQTQEKRNVGILAAWLPRWTWSCAANFNQIRSEFETHQKHVHNLTEYRGAKKGPAVIAMAGPSLTPNLPLMKDCKIPIFVPESMASTFVYHGRDPEYILVYDGGAAKTFLQNYKWKKSMMITHPAASSLVIRWWKWTKTYYLTMHVPQIETEPIQPNWQLNDLIEYVRQASYGSEFFSVIQPLLYPYITARILNAGCVANNAIQVAHFMGYDPLFLVGCDLGYPKDSVRTGDYLIPWRFPLEPRSIWKKRWKGRIHPTIDEIPRNVFISDNGIKTTEEQVEYKIAMMSVYKIDRPQLIDCSAGIITELPKADFKEVVKKDGTGFEGIYRTDTEIVKIVNDYENRIKANKTERNGDRKSEKVRNLVDGKS